ncbi:hypothetical protein G8764_11405 [Pseudomaricurvus alcaniphilus]|uniref:hypothetical protein n=1 Tax=Pseudomaricurvus alcaniphilus TaxID=1166482 RepID=UPI0014094303|nr:hypothetical protein [Pseudomaricurvus alcaniphilus]NHN37906.1 hypothetical protein [Pseudomaricurvus alcaniphilus]
MESASGSATVEGVLPHGNRAPVLSLIQTGIQFSIDHEVGSEAFYQQMKPSLQTAPLSLKYNRGANLQGESRVETAATRGLSRWLDRREDEARLVLQSPGRFADNQLVRVG